MAVPLGAALCREVQVEVRVNASAGAIPGRRMRRGDDLHIV